MSCVDIVLLYFMLKPLSNVTRFQLNGIMKNVKYTIRIQMFPKTAIWIINESRASCSFQQEQRRVRSEKSQLKRKRCPITHMVQ